MAVDMDLLGLYVRLLRHGAGHGRRIWNRESSRTYTTSDLMMTVHLKGRSGTPPSRKSILQIVKISETRIQPSRVYLSLISNHISNHIIPHHITTHIHNKSNPHNTTPKTPNPNPKSPSTPKMNPFCPHRQKMHHKQTHTLILTVLFSASKTPCAKPCIPSFTEFAREMCVGPSSKGAEENQPRVSSNIAR